MPLLEGHVERPIVEEDIGILELVVEAVLHSLHAKQYTVAVLISSKHQDGCSGAARSAATGEGM